ncbi:MAG: EAL domain-containing protein [Desulfocapsaceae bacterium]|nr:EAL domain-containing protein [Desulfocapsaceae bacterium]
MCDGIEMPGVDLEEILQAERIRTLFQPIISLKQKRMVGVEALSRGERACNGGLLPPALLFSVAAQAGCTLALDRLCRKVALTSFNGLAQRDDLLLFLNIDPGILTEGVAGSGHLHDQMAAMGLSPSRVAIEIVESRVESQELLLNFARFYRQLGCLIVLDDFGDDQSNFGRVAMLRPDIIKVSRSLVDGIAYDYYRQSVMTAIVSLADKIGSLVLAEGVERFEDIMTCHELGADLMQGFFFSHPKLPGEIASASCCKEKIDSVFMAMRSRLVGNYTRRMRRKEAVNAVLTKVLDGLIPLPLSSFDELLIKVVPECEEVECVYVLDKDGIQISDTVFRQPPMPRNSLFAPAEKGAEHQLKSYYFAVAYSDMGHFCSEPYLSHASGNLCRTVSTVFSGIDSCRYILCVDIQS